MPPKGKSLAQKRKALESDSTSKRVKKDSDVSNSSLHSLSPQKKNGVIKLSGALPKVPDDAYINQTAKDLFLQVHTYSEFCMAARIFWISFSAYARGVSQEQVDEQLEMVSKYSNNMWYMDDRSKLGWKEAYEYMLNHYIEKLNFHAKAYLESSAGIRFKNTVEKNRRGNKTLPVLDVKSLREFEGIDGIAWNTSQVYDFFSILGEISITIECEMLFDDLPPEMGEWFEFDIRSISKDPITRRFNWLDRLTQVATTLVIQWIRIHYGFAQPGGTTVEPSTNTCRQLLSHVPTEGVGDTFPPFKIDQQSLRQWMDEDNPEQSKFPTANEVDLAEIRQDIDEMAESPAPLPPAVLTQVVAESDLATRQIADSFSQAVAAMPSNPFNPLSTDDKTALAIAAIDPFKLPPAKLFVNELTPTDYAFITGNTRTKIGIAIALAMQEMEGWNILAHQCTERMDYWKTKLEELERQRSFLQQTQTGLLQLHNYLRETAAKVDHTKEEVDAARQNPLIAKQLVRQLHKSQIPPGSPSGFPALPVTTNASARPSSPSLSVSKFESLNSRDGIQHSPHPPSTTALPRELHFTAESPPSKPLLHSFSTEHLVAGTSTCFPTHSANGPSTGQNVLLPSARFSNNHVESQSDRMEDVIPDVKERNVMSESSHSPEESEEEAESDED